MADSTTPIAQVTAGTGAAAQVNNNFDQASPAMLYGRNPATTTGLTWGFIGGRYRSTSVATGTVSLTASQTNYVVANRASGAVSTSTSNANWNDTQNFERLYLVVTGTSSITSYEDHRALGQRGQNFSPVVSDGEANRDIAAADAGNYIRMTRATAKTATFRPNSTHQLPPNAEFHFRCTGAGNLTLTPGSGVTLNAPAGGTLVLGTGMTVTVKKVGTDEYDVIGQTVPA